jgi:adenosylhomocysteine nucleosidase
MNNIILLALPQEAPELQTVANVFFTGVGKVNAAMRTALLIEKFKPTQIINFGTAGGITVGAGLHQVGKYVQRDMLCSPLGVPVGKTPFEHGEVVLELSEGLTCSTGDNFVINPKLEIPADIVDMEAYAIAKVCHSMGVEFLCYKFITDSADSSANQDWNTLVSSGQTHYIEKLKELNLFF